MVSLTACRRIATANVSLDRQRVLATVIEQCHKIIVAKTFIRQDFFLAISDNKDDTSQQDSSMCNLFRHLAA